MKGPVLLAANHPNSFLDGIILASLFKHPLYGLARGDAFKEPRYSKLLKALNLLPVYRLREGAENLHQNYDSFAKCKEIFKKNGMVLIFSEGGCVNEWKLRPLKKGTARLVKDCWENNIPVSILPVGINYQSFTSFGKNIQLNFGSLIRENDIPPTNGFGNRILAINHKLENELKQLVLELEKEDKEKIIHQLGYSLEVWKKILYAPFGFLGAIVHLPLYLPIWCLLQWKARGSEHYDSIRVALLLLAYPFYLGICTYFLYLLSYPWWSVLFLMPLTARAFILVKPQF